MRGLMKDNDRLDMIAQAIFLISKVLMHGSMGDSDVLKIEELGKSLMSDLDARSAVVEN